MRAAWTEDFAEPFTHLLGGFVRKRHRQDLMRSYIVFENEVRDAAGQHAGFSAPCPGQYENRAEMVTHRLKLRRVQVAEMRCFSVFVGHFVKKVSAYDDPRQPKREQAKRKSIQKEIKSEGDQIRKVINLELRFKALS